MPGVGVGYSAVDERSPGSGVAIGLGGGSAAEVTDPVLAQECGAVVLPVVVVAALGGGSSALVAVASLFSSAVRAGAGADGVAAGGADAGRAAGHRVVSTAE